jgi:hypothetical protein
MCQKKKYRNKEKAINYMFHIRKLNPTREEKGVYFCKECGAWHLTKQMNSDTPLFPIRMKR